MAVDAAKVANQRRFLFSAKFVVDMVLMLLVVGFAIWGAGRFGGQRDFSSSGVNSLSPRTQNLLKSVDTNLTLTGIYSLALSEIRPFAEKHRGRVGDLLDLYENAGRDKVTTAMIDPSEEPARMRPLLERMQSKPAYQSEALPYQEALALYPPLAEQIAVLFQEEQTKLDGYLQQAALQQVRELTVLQQNLRIVLEEAEAVKKAVEELQAEDIPRYGQALNAIGSHFDQVAKALTVAQDWMTTSGARLPGIATDTQAFFAGAKQRFADVLTGIEQLRTASQDLAPLELEQAYEQLKAGSVVVVETNDAVKVVPFDDVWPMRTDRSQDEDGDRREFTGEQAVSSAILNMTQTDRTAIVFVRFAGGPLLQPDMAQMAAMQGRMPQAPYSVLEGVLQKENFLTAEWDVATDPKPPTVDGAVRTIYVVFPPTDPGPQALQNPQGAKSISDAQVKAVLDAVDESGMAVFLAGWQQRMPIPGASGYAYADYLRSQWGIEAGASEVVIPFQLNPRKTEAYIVIDPRNPTVLGTSRGALKFTEHPIVKPLQSLPAALTEVSPLALVSDGMPEGITHATLAEVPSDADAWGLSDIQRLQEDFQKFEGTRRYEEDIAPPFPVALVAEQGERRVAVVASDRFLSNSILEAGQLMLASGGIVMARLYPANQDFFVNTLHWLTGDADRIAVGPTRGAVPRLSELKDEHTKPLKFFLVGIWPGLALLGGAIVWFVRRR